jgi:hypothetical protein
MSITRWMLVPAVLAGWFTAAGPAPAATPTVNDEAGLFSADAVRKADQTIAKIQRDYGTGLVIDTVPRIPANLEGKFKQLGKEEFFREWAESKAKRERDKGIFILICKSPGRVEALVDEETRVKNFTYRDRDAMVKKMLSRFSEKKWDEGLLDAVNFVDTTLRSNGARPQRQRQAQTNKSETAAPPAGGPAKRGGSWMDGIGGWICIGVVVLLGLWLVFGLIRAFTGMGRGGYGPGGGYGGGPGYGGGGGGGFMSSLLGGMFGAAAGMWMYNSFFGGGSHFGSSAYGGTTPTGGGEPADTGAGDFSGDPGGGGDFGGDDGGGGGGGGDFGGGDFGGGGGGDFGGGGGDFGGGGGDFGGGGGDFGGGGGGDF